MKRASIPQEPGSSRAGSTPTRESRQLVLFLRATGTAMLLALVAVAMPRRWMADTHAWLGLGTFPSGPIVEYLARSLSAFYALFGALLWVLSADVPRYAPVLRFVAWASIPFGVALFAVDTSAGMPLYWRLGEGPLAVSLSALLLWLLRRVGA